MSAPLFRTNDVIAAIVEELQAQGVVFESSQTTKVTWTWNFEGALKDAQKFLEVLKKFMCVEAPTAAAGSLIHAPVSQVQSKKFTSGQVRIDSTGVCIWMKRAFA